MRRSFSGAFLFAVLSISSVAAADVIVSVTHEVKDYAAWKKGYDAGSKDRAKAHMNEIFLSRGIENQNLIHMAFRAPTAEGAHAFISDPKLKDVMEKSGVVGAPTIVVSTFVQGAGLKKAK